MLKLPNLDKAIYFHSILCSCGVKCETAYFAFLSGENGTFEFDRLRSRLEAIIGSKTLGRQNVRRIGACTRTLQAIALDMTGVVGVYVCIFLELVCVFQAWKLF